MQCLVGNASLYGFIDPAQILSVIGITIALAAHAATITRSILLHRRNVRMSKSTDPLKPYLMYESSQPTMSLNFAHPITRKKEIDVWCYPVQNEQGQLFMDYEPVSSSTPSKAPSVHSTRARSVRSFVRVDDEPSDTGRPQSSVETTAGWSVPSQNETLPQSERAPSTALPSYRSPRPAVQSSV